MKIGIDISQSAFKGTGVATYTSNLIENLLKVDDKNEYVLFFSSFRLNPPQNLRVKCFKFPPLMLEYLWNKSHRIPIESFIGKVDVFHSSDWLEPPAKCPKVTTIHDLAIFKYPETFLPKGGHNIVNNLKMKFEWVKKESQCVIAVSENTKKDIVEILGIPENRVKVVYEAADNIFYNKIQEKEKEAVMLKYGLDSKYILAVGTREPRKNLNNVIKAFENVAKEYPEFKLAIVGKAGWGEDINQFKITNLKFKIKVLGYVPKEDLPAIYTNAECFVYPSLYEGFGLPILESMACGCPVVTSNISSMPEVAGNAAILVSPGKIDEIADGIKKAIKNKKSLVQKGLIRSREFTWEKTARETLKIYKELNADRN